MRFYLTFLIVIFKLTMLISQNSDKSQIIDTYQLAGFDTYYIIDSTFIVSVGFCNSPSLCDYSLYIDRATYVFRNDSLFADFGEVAGDIDYSERVWIYLPAYNRFVDQGLGEYLRVDPEVINKKLQPFGLKLSNIKEYFNN